MDIDFEDLERRANKDNVDIELLRTYLISLEKMALDSELLNQDDAIDQMILGYYTWKRSEMIREAALESDLPGHNNLFEPFEGNMNVKQRRLLETITEPDPILNYHVAGLVHAAERVKEFTSRFGITTPLHKLLRDYIFRGKE